MGGCFSSSSSRNKRNESDGLSAAFQIAIPVPAATVWAVVLDVEHWPDFIGWIESTEMLSRAPPPTSSGNSNSRKSGGGDQRTCLKVGSKWKEVRRMDRRSNKTITEIKTVLRLGDNDNNDDDNNNSNKPGEFCQSLGYLVAFPEEHFDTDVTNMNTLMVQSVDNDSSSGSCVLIMTVAFAATGPCVTCHCCLCDGCLMRHVEEYCMQELEDFAHEAQRRHREATAATSDVKK